MPRHGPILNLGRPLADGDHIDDMPLSTLRVVALGATHPPRSTQMRRQLLLQHTAGLNEETAIDRFVRYLHVLVGWELLLQPAGDLFRRPLQRELLRPAPSCPPMQRQTTWLRAQRSLPGTSIGLVCTIALNAAVAPDLPTYCRWRPSETLSDPPDRPARRDATGNLFAFLKP